MRLTALVDSPTHVCARYRLTAFRPWLERAGHALTLLPLPRNPLGWPGLLHQLRRTDAVVVQRKLLHPVLLGLLRLVAPRLLFDLDDAIWLRDSYDPRGQHCAARRRRFGWTCRLADALVAGNAYLAEQAAPLAGRERVHLVPTCVDPEAYPLAQHERQGPGVKLVWIGSSSTLQGLERIRPLLERVGRDCPGVRLKVVCDRPLALDHLSTVFRPWSEATEAADLAAADIGISWLPDDDWSRGKCGLKVLQYLAAGLPVVANPVGVHPELVRPNETGFLATTADDWVAAVNRLAQNAALRQRLGLAGRRLVAADYSVLAGAERWLELLERLSPEAGSLRLHVPWAGYRITNRAQHRHDNASGAS